VPDGRAARSAGHRHSHSPRICQHEESPIHLIRPRTRGKQFVRLTTCLDRENSETLYAHFIGESAEYVLNQLVETVLAKDKSSSRGVRSTPTRVCRCRCVSAGRRSRPCRLIVHGRLH